MHQHIHAQSHTHTDTCVFIQMLNEANYNKMKYTINFILYIFFLENKLLLQRTPQLYSRTSKSQSVILLDVSSHWLVIIPQHFDIAYGTIDEGERSLLTRVLNICGSCLQLCTWCDQWYNSVTMVQQCDDGYGETKHLWLDLLATTRKN